jgi:hypothetical protein
LASFENLVTRWMAPAALLGGAVWVLRAVWLALMPAGCVGASCTASSPTRDSGSLTPLLIIAVALMAFSVVGMVTQVLRTGRLGRLGRTGVIAIVMAGFELAAYEITHLAGSDIPALAAMGGPLMALGVILTGVALLRAGIVHKSAVMALLLGSVAMLGYNDQNAQALLAVPFGVAWLVVGLTLLLRTDPASEPATEPKSEPTPTQA